MGAKMSKVAPDQIAGKVTDAEAHGGTLDLHACSLDVECARQLSLVLEASTLEKVILSANEIGDPGAVYLGPSLTKNLHLHRLVLMGNSIGDAGVAALVDGLVANRHLRDLDLHDNNITEAGGLSLARLLRYTHHLEHLLVGSNTIGDKGVRAMIAAIKKNHRGKIHTLGLSANKLTDDSATRLWHLADKYEHTVTKIELGFNDINDYQTLELIKATCQKNKEFTTLKAWQVGHCQLHSFVRSFLPPRARARSQPLTPLNLSTKPSGDCPHDRAQHDVHQKKRGEKSQGTGTVDQLTPEQKKNLIDASELGDVLKECHHGEEPDPELVKDMLEDADVDGSGLVEKVEFMQMMARQMAGSESESESSSSEEDEDSDEEVLKALGLWAKDPSGMPEGQPPSPGARKAGGGGGAAAEQNKFGHVWAGDDHMHECDDCGQMVYLWCSVCEACKNCDDLGKGHACSACPPAAAAAAPDADAAELAEIDSLADLDDLEALDFGEAESGGGAAGTTSTANPIAKAAATKDELMSMAAEAVPLAKGEARKKKSDAEGGLSAQRERAKARIAAAKVQKQEQAEAEAQAKGAATKGKKPKAAKASKASKPAPAPAPGADPGVAKHMVNLE
jgi:hypothetical protein